MFTILPPPNTTTYHNLPPPPTTTETKLVCAHFKEIDFGLNDFFNLWGTEPPFRANLLFGYAQSGSERTSFSGSTVLLTCNVNVAVSGVFFYARKITSWLLGTSGEAWGSQKTIWTFFPQHSVEGLLFSWP